MDGPLNHWTTEWSGVVWSGVVWSGVEWYGMEWKVRPSIHPLTLLVHCFASLLGNAHSLTHSQSLTVTHSHSQSLTQLPTHSLLNVRSFVRLSIRPSTVTDGSSCLASLFALTCACSLAVVGSLWSAVGWLWALALTHSLTHSHNPLPASFC